MPWPTRCGLAERKVTYASDVIYSGTRSLYVVTYDEQRHL